MTKNDVIEAAKASENKFKTAIDGEQYQLRGIFNSEALLLTSIVNFFGVDLFIESGRARGYSTNLIAKYFADDSKLQIASIDFDSSSDDAKYSETYLAKYKNVKLLYGDSHNILPGLISEDCIVFIDGPKGDEAIQLAIKVMKDSRVKAVAIHDLHKNTWHRNICEAIFTNTFFSDDREFVEMFKQLDIDCWKVLEGTGEAPYQRYGKPNASYASTLGVFFNSDTPFIQPALDNYLTYYKANRPTFTRAFIAQVPHDSIFYKIVSWLYRLIK